MGNRPVSPESATEWQLKLIVWEFFCTLTWSGRARTIRPGVQDPLGYLAFVTRWERGEIGGLPHCHILISRFPSDQSEYVLRDRSGLPFSRLNGLHSERDCQAYLLSVRMFSEAVRKLSVCRGE
jgi:hypothetical protein